jgi:hypothetical protein
LPRKLPVGDNLVEVSWTKKDAHRLQGLGVSGDHNWKLAADQLGRLAEEVKGNKEGSRKLEERLAALEESHKASIEEIKASIQSQRRQQ